MLCDVNYGDVMGVREREMASRILGQSSASSKKYGVEPLELISRSNPAILGG